MKSAYENYFQISLENLQKSLPFRVIYVKKILIEKKNVKYIGIDYCYITYLSLPISCKIKRLRYTFDSLVNIRLINKELREHVNISV